MTLIVYYFSKLKLTKNFKWSYDIQLLTEYDKKNNENIRELIYEIKDN
jgi:hypothetical protein